MFDLEGAIKTAIKAKDPVALSAWRSLKAKVAIKLTEAGRGEQPLTERELAALARREIRERKESNEFLKEGQPEFSANERIAALLEPLLPSQPSPEELEALIAKSIAEVDPAGPREMGKVMAALRQAAPGLDMAAASARVKELLAAKG